MDVGELNQCEYSERREIFVKRFEMPEIEVQVFAVEDVIAASGGAWGGNELPR